jgi:HEPN domain-containing protein
MREKEALAKDWFLRGNRDLADAKILLREKGSTETICFLAHQAVEKYLKGFLVYNNVNPRRTHELVDLINRCADIDKDFLDFREEVKSLNPYYIEARYPLGSPIEYPREDAVEAIEIAERIIDFTIALIS